MASMRRFFAVWRAISDLIFTGMTVVCGAMCLVGASQVYESSGPPWMVITMALAGIVILVAISLRQWRRRAAPPSR